MDAVAELAVARPERGARSVAPATSAVFIVTAVLTGLSLVNPCVLRALMRSPRILDGEVWRLVTALCVERGGVAEITLHLVTLAVVGTVAERLRGSRRWLDIDVAGGVSGEFGGLAWKPLGAGSSVAMLALAGACALAVVRRRAPWPLLTALVVVTGVALTALQNLHGPPLLVGAALAAVFARRRVAARASG